MNVKTLVVCVIEPNRFEGQIVIDLLRNAGVINATLFTNQAQALEALQHSKFNMIIASFEMTPLDAAAWTRAYRRNRSVIDRQAPMFITSSAFSRSMAEQCRHAGANALIGKPLSGKVLMATINKVLGSPRAFIDAAGYVGPCRRAGIVTAGAPKKRRTADASAADASIELMQKAG